MPLQVLCFGNKDKKEIKQKSGMKKYAKIRLGNPRILSLFQSRHSCLIVAVLIVQIVQIRLLTHSS